MRKKHSVINIFHSIGLTPLLSAVVFFVVHASCTNSNKEDSVSDGQQKKAALAQIENFKEKEEEIDIPIAINLAHAEDEEKKQLKIAEYEITHETDKDIYIDINSDYYKKYTSGKRFRTEHLVYLDNSENVEFLSMNLDVVNNTKKKLSINELNVLVEKSEPDKQPIVYICTTDSYSNCIYFVNESWFNWKGFTFSYSLMRKGESFNGFYKKTRHISYFDNYFRLDLLSDMKEMGYDFDGLVNYIMRRNLKHDRGNDDGPIYSDENSKYLGFCIENNDDDFDFFQKKFSPFELKKNIFDEFVGVATIYGSLMFDNSNFKVDFVAEISLSTSGDFGANSYENDKFDVNLKSIGEDYVLRYPYTTVIEPYGAEMIKLSMKADKPSMHKFHIDIKNNNGLKIKSKNIHFHYYYPKH